MPALPLDAALVHVHRADPAGTGQVLGPDLYMDDLFLAAASGCRFLSCERIASTDAMLAEGPLASIAIHRGLTDGVVCARGGAHFTECPPDYGRDEAFQRAYAASAASPEAWAAFRARFLDVSEADYLRAAEEASR
jgi:glutaconate CoA-transferase subunit A